MPDFPTWIRAISDVSGGPCKSQTGAKTSQKQGIRVGYPDIVARMSFTPLVGTLAYLWDHETDRVLLVRRNARFDDVHLGKVNGLGGKLEPDESVVDGLRRELREEADVELTSYRLRGTVTWTNFGPRHEQWLGFIFVVDGWTGSPPRRNPEGTLEWVDRVHLLAACDHWAEADGRRSAPVADDGPELPMWPGDRHFLPLVFDEDPRQFHGTMPYDGDRPLGWSFERN